MSTPPEFPGNCITNTHILHDFTEIAYIVCTHAIPATSETGVNTNSPDRILDRLRNAEKQFRQHSILVALDSDKLELFTFYRKVDVIKDQRTILNKFGYVCRLNSCIFSAKSATRVYELLKPESSRIYALFTSAVLSSIQIVPRNGEHAIPIGKRGYLVSKSGISQNLSGSTETPYVEWYLQRVDIQVTAAGQLVLIVQSATGAPLHLALDAHPNKMSTLSLVGSSMFLAPTGQMARYSGGLICTAEEAKTSIETNGEPYVSHPKWAHSSISTVALWLKQNHPSSFARVDENSRWIQVEIPVFETGTSSSGKGNKAPIWKSLMWPAMLAFIFKKLTEADKSAKPDAVDTDPLEIAMNWYNNSAERNSMIARAQTSNDFKDEAEDEPPFTDEAVFEDQYSSQAFGPPIFPASQMVYPTPPEGILAHPTPGMSSVDGIAPTPAPVLASNQPETETFLDQEMPDVSEIQPIRAGAGFYEEDLFEEMPDGKFGPTASADEPNWDFFDPSDTEPHEDTDEKNDFVSGHAEPCEIPKEFQSKSALDEDQSFLLSTGEKNNQDIAIHDVNFTDDGPNGVHANKSPVSGVISQEHHHTSTENGTTGISRLDAGRVRPKDSEEYEPNSQSFQRRLSIFDSVDLHQRLSHRDDRYNKHGKYWFEERPLIGRDNMILPTNSEQKRPASSGSDTSTTSDASGSSAKSSTYGNGIPSTKRAWTEYHPDTPAKEVYQHDDRNDDQSNHEIGSLLNVIGAATGEDLFLIDIESVTRPRRHQSCSMQKTLMVAQILVDQISQSSLLRHDQSMQLHRKPSSSFVDVTMDHSGVKAPISHATLSELSSHPSRNTDQISKLDSRLLCINRSEGEIAARPSILPFWDTLGLHPYNRAKDVTAFCLHPNSANVAEGCTSFMGRAADTYMTCNFGGHVIGRFDGLTSDGLLAWMPENGPGPSLKQTCQRLGSVIGGASTTSDTTYVIYIVSSNTDGVAYREICHAFTLLFESFLEASEGVKGAVELVLQIVPVTFIASPDTLVVPSQAVYLELAIEVYNRVPIRRAESTPGICGSATILNDNQTRDPVFELSTTPISPLSKDGPCLHLAYSYSVDKRWLTAAWSDERGTRALTMSYCLRASTGGKSRPISEVFRNMWEISHDVMGRSCLKWRLVVAQPAAFDPEDVVEWQQLASSGTEDTIKGAVKLILLSVNLDPDVMAEIKHSLAKLSHQALIPQGPNVSATPGSTPQGHVTSPDQLVAATPTSGVVPPSSVSTPPEQNIEATGDAEASLLDPADQCWAIMLPFGLNQSSSFLDIRPAVASGFLVKRTTSKDEHKTLQLVGINLIAAQRSQSMTTNGAERDTILREMIEQFRGLVTLAVSRGCINKDSDCVPWHIATVIKAARVLGDTM